MKNAFLTLTTKQRRLARLAPRRIANGTSRRGQALVETALVVTILLFLSMGLVQFALLANARTTLTNLSREGARYAAVHALESGSDTAIKNYVVTVAASTPLRSIVATDVTVSPVYGNAARTSSQPITVTVSYNMHSKFILPSSFPGLSKFGSASTTSTSTAIMIIE